MPSLAFLGCGSWGGALGLILAKKGVTVTMWHRDHVVAEYMKKTRIHYLVPELHFPENVFFSTDIDKVFNSSDIVVVAIPSQSIRDVITQIENKLVNDNKVIVNVSKGIEIDTLKTASQIIKEIVGVKSENTVTLSGPSHAEEVVAGHPTTLVSASVALSTAKKIQNLFSNEKLRIYTNNDIRGVELGGAMKNVIAIAAGISDGIGFGDNSKAALMTRGMREIARLGQAMGADPSTFAGLSGMGDLIVTCLSKYSRNWNVGYQIGEGKKLKEILNNMRMVAEGIETAKSIHKLKDKFEVEMPISENIYQILFHAADPKESVSNLMGRELSHEL